MIYIETGSEDVYYNFGLEYYFTLEKKVPDTVFLFWRTTPTLMVGKYQNVLEEINLPYARQHGIHLVRRMSGGGTIYTDLGGWQYTFIQHTAERRIEFLKYTAPIIGAIRSLGGDASFDGRNDLLIKGRKFSGTAQYRLEDAVVHHGSLLFATDIEAMTAATTVDPYKIISRSIKSVRDRVANLSEFLPGPLTSGQFKAAVVQHVMDGSTAVYKLTPEDDRRIRELAEEKFRSWKALYGTNPKFNIERTGHCRGGRIQFKLDVQHGIIRNASVYGDFFAALDAETIAGSLIGCRYEHDAVLAALRSHGLDHAIYRIPAEDMAAVIAVPE